MFIPVSTQALLEKIVQNTKYIYVVKINIWFFMNRFPCFIVADHSLCYLGEGNQYIVQVYRANNHTFIWD